MTLGQALALANRKPDHGQYRHTLFLACGFQPLHLVTFLKAHFASRFPGQVADVETGLYGDLEGTIAAAAKSNAEAAVLIIEWSDIDPRLGLRSAGGWALSVQRDILESSGQRLARLLSGLRTLAAKMPVGLVAATLPIRLLGHTSSWQGSLAEMELQRQLGNFLADAAATDGVRIMSSSRLSRLSPEPSRPDPLMELQAGFPYSIPYSSALASQLLQLLFPPAPLKGLITDLDDTFWSGIVGELGVDGVSWSLTEHSQIHALYQQMLRHLSEMGVLLAIASKNEQSVVEEALRRDDLLVPAKAFFPVCANWGPKSHSIARILQTWNIAADSVVFVDDSEMELDEVRTAFPSMTCVRFLKKQPARTVEVLEQLRDLFGKPQIHQDDALRQASIRVNAALQAAAQEAPDGEFIRNLQGKTTFDCRKDPANKRILELINKTNQFNLNGVRISEGEWLKFLEDDNAVAVAVSHEEKFGPLGTIGVLAGRRSSTRFELTSWVLSCRAFSRKIEHHMMDFLFNRLGIDSVCLSYRPTDRNQPVQNYLKSIGLDVDGGRDLLLSREQFQNYPEELPHEVRLQN